MKTKVHLLAILLLLVAPPLFAGPAPDFTFTDLEGNTYTAAGLKGTPLVVSLGSHW